MKANTTTNILSLTSKEAMDYFMKSEQYHGFELPEYFDFDKALDYVRTSIGDRAYEDCLAEGVRPDDVDGVNMDILLNKDGHYAVRPLVLANPYLYYFLVREVGCPAGWATMQECFRAYRVPRLTSCALPVVAEKAERFHKSTTILNWWNAMEQRSIELSLEYRYMFVTDITNCYGSIIPQSIEWALTRQGTKHEDTKNQPLAERIQTYLRALQHGHNIGIPQGSALFDFVAEVVLGYSDLLLHEALQREEIAVEYEIIRYRDDYRIFCNDRDELERISCCLQTVLGRLNLRLNSQKTKVSDTLIEDAIKPDKLAYIYNTPVFNKKGVDFDSFEKHLLFILMFGRRYPNSGQLKILLSDIDKRIEDWLKPAAKPSGRVVKTKAAFSGDKAWELTKAEEVELGVAKAESTPAAEATTKTEPDKKSLPGGSVRALTAVATQIALDNVGASHYALRVASRMVDSLTDMKEKQDIIQKVYQKLCSQRNSDYNQLWLQNITYTHDMKSKRSPYTIPLCQLVMGKTETPIWNNGWLKQELTEGFPTDSIVNRETLKLVTPVITFRETRAYNA